MHLPGKDNGDGNDNGNDNDNNGNGKAEKIENREKPNVDKCKIIRDNNAANGCVD